MADVTLKLKADNSDIISKLKQTQREQEKLFTSNKQNYENVNGLIVKEQKQLENLLRWRLKANDPEMIADYNRQIQEQVNSLNKLENAGVQATEKITKSGNSMLGSIKSWALGFASVATAIGLITAAFKATEQGLRTFNVIGAITKQILYDIVQLNGLNLANILLSIKANKEAEVLRQQQRKDLVEIAKAQRTYNELYFAASDRTKTETERLQVLNQTLLAHEALMGRKIKQAESELAVIALGLAARPEETKLLDAYYEKLAEIETLKGQGPAETKRLESQRTLINKEQLEKTQKFWEDYADWFGTNLDNLSADERKQALETMQINQDVADYLENLDKEWFKDQDKKWKSEEDFQRKLYLARQKGAKAAWDKMVEDEKKVLALEKYSVEQRKENLKSFSDSVQSFVSTLQEISQAKVEKLQFQRELFDTQISEVQSELQIESDLRNAGYASNVAAKQKELEALKIQRDNALKEEEAARKKAQTIAKAAFLAEKAAAIAQVIVSTIIANAKALAASPLTFGMPWVAYNKVTAALSIAAIIAAMASVASVKLAKGGSGTDTGMITGKSHARGGERFTDNIEVEHGEAWGVLSVPASQKFGKVFHHMVSSFNKGEIPSITPVNNINNRVMVENDGPNTRLDQVIREQQKLNNRLSASDTIQEIAGAKVIRKGNVTRIIR